MTLAVLTLAAASMVAVGRAAIDRAAQARAAQDELQRRWGAISARNAILPFAEPILEQLEARERRAIPALRTTVQLGRQRVTLVLADEQAKANVNQMFEHLGASRTEDRLRQNAAGAQLFVKLRPEPIPDNLRRRATTSPARAGVAGSGDIAGGASAVGVANGARAANAASAASRPAAAPAGPPPANDRPISGFGQIFGGPTGQTISPARLALPPRGYDAAALADTITCWGNGAINVRRTTPAALRLATSLTPSDIARLIDARDAWRHGRALPANPPPHAAPSNNVAGANAGTNGAGANPNAAGANSASVPARLLGAANVDPARGNDAMPASLIDTSNCHSLWVITDDGRRQWFDFAVLDTTDGQHPQMDAESW